LALLAVGLHRRDTMIRTFLVIFAILAVAAGGSSVARAQRDPYAVATFCTPYPIHTRPAIAVRNGAELQNALDDAQAGDTIQLEAGATFRPPEGSFVLRNRSIPAGQWVVIRSSSRAFDPDGQIPPNQRVTPAAAKLMPQLRVSSQVPVIRTAAGARGYRLVGLDIGVDRGVNSTALVELGAGDDASSATQPSDIVIDRSYLHGNDAGNFRRGIAINGSRLAIIESHLENFHDDSTDSQGILGWNGPGPFKIVNNFLEAASQSVMFGGNDPSIPGLVPADIEIRRNLMTRRLAWRETKKIPVKNAFELKSARRVLVEGNVFENVWTSGQDGTAIVLKSTNQNGRCTHCVSEYVTFRNNIVRNAASGLLINAAEVGRPGAEMPERVNHIRVHNVLFLDIGSPQWGSGGKLFRIFGGASDISIQHVTSTSNPRGILDARDARDANPNLVFGYNLVERRQYGIGAGGDEGVPTLSRNFPQSSYKHNVLVNTSASTDQSISDSALKAKYPAQTLVARDWKEVSFEEGTYRLAAGSPFRGAGDDGKDLGVDWDELQRAQSGPGGSAPCVETPERPPTARPRPRPRN
jgi:hypothetical protein